MHSDRTPSFRFITLNPPVIAGGGLADRRPRSYRRGTNSRFGVLTHPGPRRPTDR